MRNTLSEAQNKSKNTRGGAQYVRKNSRNRRFSDWSCSDNLKLQGLIVNAPRILNKQSLGSRRILHQI